MGRHVVAPLIVMDKPWISLWYQIIYKSLEVLSHRRIGIFIDAQTGRSMLDKHLQKTDSDFLHFRNTAIHLISNQVVALWITRKFELFLKVK